MPPAGYQQMTMTMLPADHPFLKLIYDMVCSKIIILYSHYFIIKANSMVLQYLLENEHNHLFSKQGPFFGANF